MKSTSTTSTLVDNSISDIQTTKLSAISNLMISTGLIITLDFIYLTTLKLVTGIRSSTDLPKFWTQTMMNSSFFTLAKNLRNTLIRIMTIRRFPMKKLINTQTIKLIKKTKRSITILTLM